MGQTKSTSSEHSDESNEFIPTDRKAPILQDEEYISNRIDPSVDQMSSLSVKNQNKYKFLKRAAIIIGATIPLCVTLTAFEAVDQERWIKVPLLIYSALGGTVLALMNNLLKTGNYYDQWKRYRSITETLLREKYLYLTKMPPYDGGDAFPIIVEKVEELLDDEEDKLDQASSK